MRPLRLTIEGLRSFRAPVSIDFTGRDHIAIVGDTGAGKSSILEAITYALYGQTTFTAQANQELMNDTSSHMRVVLRFQVSGETWEVARTLRRASDGTVVQPNVQLRKFGAAGEAVEQVEQVRRVNERVKELLGLDSDAFLRTVVLPQGRFARLLVEDEPRDRSRILRQVWPTDELEEAGGLAGEARQEAVTLRVRLEQAASAYPENPDAHLAGLEEVREAASRQAVVASEVERVAIAARDSVVAAGREQEAASGVLGRLRVLETGRVAERLAPVAEIDRGIAEENAALMQRQAFIEEELSRIPSGDGPMGEEVAAALTTLQSIGGLAAAGMEAANTLRASEEDRLRKHAEARGLTESAEGAQEQAAEHARRRPQLADEVEMAQARRAAVDQEYSRYEERVAELEERQRQLGELRQAAAVLAEQLQTAQEDEGRATRAAAETDEHLAAARRSESAASAAHGLHSGDECPVCRRDLPPDWEPPEGARLGEAEQIADAARQAARQAEQELTRIRTERTGIEGQIADSGDRLAAAETLLTDALQELARNVDIDSGAQVPGRDTLLAPLEAACTGAADRLAEHDRVNEELRLEATRQETAASVASTAAANADTLVEHTRTAAADSLERLMVAIQAVPPAFQLSLALPDDAADLHEVDTSPVDAQTNSAQDRAQVLAERASERQRLETKLVDTGTARSVLERRRVDEVEAPLDEIVHDLNAHRDVLVESVSRLALNTNVPTAVSAREIAELTSWMGELGTTTANVSRAAEEHLRAAADRAEAASTELTALGNRLGVDIGMGTDAVVESAGARANDARFEARRAREVWEDFAAIIDDVRDLRALLAEVEGKERALGDLDDALKPGAFLKWLTLRRSRRLLVHASRMLGEMSAGKYAFVDPGENEEQWRVLDRDSGQARSPASLSGGEQFIASLSLALGMVEMMARSGGRLESLFLDEGFGSLDRNNLDSAVQALRTVAAGGRMVGVISHVRAVAEQIDHVLAVTREATGSRAEWLTGPQRQQLAESDTGWEAASALGGLLD